MRGVLPTWDHSSTSWMSYHSVQFWQYLPGLSGRSHRLRARPARGPLQVHKLPTLLTDQLSIRGLWNALRFCHLLEWVTELRKSGLLLLLIYCKVYFQRYKWTARWKWRVGQGVREEAQSCHRPGTALCSPKLKLTKPFVWRVFKELSLQCLSGWGWKV